MLLVEQPSRISVTGEPRAALCGMGICFECRAVVNGIPHRRTCQILCEQRHDRGDASMTRTEVLVIGAGPAGIAAATAAAENGRQGHRARRQRQLAGGQIWRKRDGRRERLPHTEEQRHKTAGAGKTSAIWSAGARQATACSVRKPQELCRPYTRQIPAAS